MATVVLTLLIALNAFPALRGPDDWRWAYALPGEPWRTLVPTAVLAVYGLVIFRWLPLWSSEAVSNGRSLTLLFIIYLFVPLIQLSLLSVNSPDIWRQLFYRTVSAGSSGVFSVGTTINDSASFLANYPSLMPSFPVHPQRYPPGLPLLFYFTRDFWAAFPSLSSLVSAPFRLYQCTDFNLMRLPDETLATAVLQMLLPLINGLIVFPLYGLARRSIGRQVAWWAVVVYPIIPSFALWAGRWDQFYPLLTVSAWYFFYRGLVEKKRPFVLLAGFIVSIASFFSFGNVAILLPMGLWALLWLFVAHDWRQTLVGAVVDGLIFIAGVLSLWLLYELRFGLGLREIWQVSMGFHLGLDRSYWTWLGYHLYDFGLFLAVPLALLLVAAFWLSIQQMRKATVLLPLAFTAGLLLLDLSGTSRGEVARVWLFLTPFAVIAAVWVLHQLCQQASLRQQQVGLGLVFVLVAGQLLVFNHFLRVVNTGLSDPAPRVAQYALPTSGEKVDYLLGEGMRLVGFETAVLPTNTTLQVDLVWQQAAQMQRPYTVFLHLLDEGGNLVAQKDNMPVSNNLPTTCWLPDEVVIDPYTIELNRELAEGTYQLVTGAYWLETGERLKLPNGVDHVQLTAVVIDQ